MTEHPTPQPVAAPPKKTLRSIALGVMTGWPGGLASGLLGLGGAFLFIPPMIRFQGLTRHKAHATSLGIMFWTALAAVAFLNWQQALPVHVAGSMDVGAIIGVSLGTFIMPRLRSKTLALLFGGFLILASIYTGIHGFLHIRPILSDHGNNIWLAALGFTAGLLSGVLGVGSGGLVVPILTGMFGLSQFSAQAVSLAVILPVSFLGGLIYWFKGISDKQITFSMGASSALAAIGGTYLAERIPEVWLSAVFGVMLAYVGINNFVTGVRSKT